MTRTRSAGEFLRMQAARLNKNCVPTIAAWKAGRLKRPAAHRVQRTGDFAVAVVPTATLFYPLCSLPCTRPLAPWHARCHSVSVQVLWRACAQQHVRMDRQRPHSNPSALPLQV